MQMAAHSSAICLQVNSVISSSGYYNSFDIFYGALVLFFEEASGIMRSSVMMCEPFKLCCFKIVVFLITTSSAYRQSLAGLDPSSIS